MPQPIWNEARFSKLASLLAFENDTNFSIQSLAELREMMTNHSLHVDHEDFDLLRSPAWRALIIGLYLMVILIGVVGNSLVVYVVAKHRQLQNITNVFIANLAISDIGLCVFSLPIQLHYQLTDHWIFGSGLCRVVFSAFAMPMYVSTITIMLIAFDRYWIIVYPLRRRMTFKTAVLLILVTAAISLLLSVPVMYFTTLHTVNDTDLEIYRSYCVERWPVVSARVVYSVIMFTFQFFLPLLLTTIIYHQIYSKLRKRNCRRQDTERKNRTNKILVAIVAVFAVCWLPWNVFSLITEFQYQIVRGRHFKFLDLLLKLFAMSSACVNPFLYCWLNDNFRREVDSIVVRFKRRASGRMRNGRTPEMTYEFAPPTNIRKEGRPSVTTTNHLTALTIMVDQGSTSQAPSPFFGQQCGLLVPGGYVGRNKLGIENSVMEISAAEPSHVDAAEANDDLDVEETQRAAEESRNVTRTNSNPTSSNSNPSDSPTVLNNAKTNYNFSDPLHLVAEEVKYPNGMVVNQLNGKSNAQIYPVHGMPTVTVIVTENESESSGQDIPQCSPDLKPLSDIQVPQLNVSPPEGT